MTHLHSHAHIEEAGYHAVRHALFPNGYPLERDPRTGRFLSHKAVMNERLRSEMQSQNNDGLAEEIDRVRAA